MSVKTLLVTSALPYANGPIHLGHLLEYIQTDIWVRYQKLLGHTCYYVCADDAHGTPIMLHAEQKGVQPENLISTMHAEHCRDFSGFLINFDCYHSTHSPENRALCEQIYKKIKSEGAILRKEIQQLYDAEKELFLPDRFIRGTCPKCSTPDQYGDSCENCGATYDPTELHNPISAISGSKPVNKKTEHLFFDLPKFEQFLQDWTDKTLQPETKNKLAEWFKTGLKAWDISRDRPYFGFEIPGEPNKFFYVWLDAPIGYLAAFKKLCEQEGLNFEELLSPDNTNELYHFIGKDIMYFHCLFWPAILSNSNLKLPNGIFIHGFVTINGQKMSKTRGTFITADAYLKHLNPEYLRYYFAAKLGRNVEDIDLNTQDFMQRVNSDLVGKVVNIASRCAGFIHSRFNGMLADSLDTPELFEQATNTANQISEAYQQREYGKAMRIIMKLADQANQYIDEKKPWQIAKQSPTDPTLQQICTTSLNLFRLLILYLKPVLPTTATKVEDFLQIPALDWTQHKQSLLNHKIDRFKPLIKRIEPAQIEALTNTKSEPKPMTTSLPSHDDTTIDIKDFVKLDLRVAQIIHAEAVENADKLLRLELDIGDEKRTVLAGIKKSYQPEQLVGRLTVILANLAPRKMRFGISEGMVLAAGEGDTIFLLSPDSGAVPGMKIK